MMGSGVRIPLAAPFFVKSHPEDPSPLRDQREQAERGGDDRPFADLPEHNGLQGCLPGFVRRQARIFGDDLGIGVGEAEHRLKERKGR